MNSLIVQTWARLLKPLMLMFSVFLLIRGHHEPGGGFVGGMVAAGAFALSGLAFNVSFAQRTLRIAPVRLVGFGLILAAGSGLVALLQGNPYMTGTWVTFTMPWLGTFEIGTPILFDVGVYLVVMGITLMMVFALMEFRDQYGT